MKFPGLPNIADADVKASGDLSNEFDDTADYDDVDALRDSSTHNLHGNRISKGSKSSKGSGPGGNPSGGGGKGSGGASRARANSVQSAKSSRSISRKAHDAPTASPKDRYHEVSQRQPAAHPARHRPPQPPSRSRTQGQRAHPQQLPLKACSYRRVPHTRREGSTRRLACIMVLHGPSLHPPNAIALTLSPSHSRTRSLVVTSALLSLLCHLPSPPFCVVVTRCRRRGSFWQRPSSGSNCPSASPCTRQWAGSRRAGSVSASSPAPSSGSPSSSREQQHQHQQTNKHMSISNTSDQQLSCCNNSNHSRYEKIKAARIQILVH